MKHWMLALYGMLFAGMLEASNLPFRMTYGEWQQGSVVAVQVDDVQQLLVDDKPLLMDAQGNSVFGIGRDATEVSLRWQDKDGNWHHRQQAIASRTYDIQHINGLPNNKVNPNPQEVAEIQANNRLVAQTRAKPSVSMTPQLPMIWPTAGRISGVYGSQRVLNGEPRRPHFGVDIAAPEGTAVVAPSDGQVVLVHPNMVLTGQTMMIDHGLGLMSIYVHLSDMNVSVGDYVKRGQLIGKVGKTGRATGPHLHWGMTWRDVQIDAAKLVATPTPPSLVSAQ
ncbi:MAG: M23 family metallopeptidase [Gammaproteobacteria bacterium]|nr:M23 family metallopeptidase [Gammaproteobacteria bacterium]